MLTCKWLRCSSAGVLALTLVGGCDAGEEAAAPTPDASAKPAGTVEEKPAPAFEAPRDDEPPPAPAGTVAVKADSWLYVQTCSATHPCKDMLQAQGESHCRDSTIGDRDGWRLPSRAEAEAFAGAEGLEQLGGYHWTRTPYEEDDGQVWIVDPAGAQPTTLPRDRKPLRVRCVNEA